MSSRHPYLLTDRHCFPFFPWPICSQLRRSGSFRQSKESAPPTPSPPSLSQDTYPKSLRPSAQLLRGERRRGERAAVPLLPHSSSPDRFAHKLSFRVSQSANQKVPISSLLREASGNSSVESVKITDFRPVIAERDR